MKVKIHFLTYIFILISFLSGYFEYIFLLLLIIFIHESGHYFFSKIVKIKNPYIIIYPFGGITILNEDLNIPLYKEFIALIGGVIFQLLFYYLIYYLYINNNVTYHVFYIIKRINCFLLCFNFLPIIPLDGGRLFNIILNTIFNYRLSNKISIVLSIISLIIYTLFNRTILTCILVIFLIKCIYFKINYLNIEYNKFLLERYINKYKFRKNKNIKNTNQFKRDYYHYINNVPESVILYKTFDRRHRMC